MNSHILYYNKLVFDFVEQSNGVVWMPSLRHFLDDKHLLSSNLTRDGEIHLNARGVARFVRCMKDWIYRRESVKQAGRRQRDTLTARPGSLEPT